MNKDTQAKIGEWAFRFVLPMTVAVLIGSSMAQAEPTCSPMTIEDLDARLERIERIAHTLHIPGLAQPLAGPRLGVDLIELGREYRTRRQQSIVCH